MEKFDRLLVKIAPILVIVSLLAVPIGVWYKQKVAIPNQYPPGTKIFNLTGVGELGSYTLNNVGGYNYWNGAGKKADNIVVNKGDKVVFRLTSADVAHSFYIPEFGVDVTGIKAGHVYEASFVADKVGTFTYRCREFCGPPHPTMFGTITVKEN